MKYCGDGFELSTGKTFYAHGGQLSIHKDGAICHGWDGSVDEQYTFTEDEKREIAAYMIEKWLRWVTKTDELAALRDDLVRVTKERDDAIKRGASFAACDGDAIAGLRAVVLEFAASDPWLWIDTTGTRKCQYCGAPRPGQHTDACVWLRAQRMG